MRFVLKRLLLGFELIALASASLLLSDLGRRTAAARSVPHIGLLQHASTMLLDEGTRGAIDGLAANGFLDGKTIVIEKFNAQGDISVGNSIAKEMVNARYDLLLTMSTLSLQAVANANRGGKTIQVFGLVADPVVAGVGISRNEPLNHPRNLVGIGSFLPVKDAFQIAREMFPDRFAIIRPEIPAALRSRLAKRPPNAATRYVLSGCTSPVLFPARSYTPSLVPRSSGW
jgi:putative ABC transport system substrate-binding protein